MLRPLTFSLLILSAIPSTAFAEALISVNTSSQLQSAFGTISNGGVIEIAGGTYAAPSGGFAILNPNKSFTVRPASGSTVILDGGGTQLVLRYMSDNPNLQGHVTFEDLTFRNGRSTVNARGGGITQQMGRAVFVRCVVESNFGSVGGGGYWGFAEAHSWWIDSTFQNNTSFGSGAGLRLDIGTTWIHHSTFFQNRNNIVGHATTAVGGGIHLFDAKAYITNSRFEANQSVWAGGAVYGIGTFTVPYTTPKTDFYIANCTFLDNFLSFQSGSAPPTPGEGGGIHIENQVRLRLYNSRLIKNRASIGGGLSLFRSTAEIEGSVFRGNQATDTVATSGFGGAIKASSDDGVGPNYPSASLTVRDTLIQGRYDTVTTVARAGGGIFVAGDTNRAYGAGGVPQGTLEESRAHLVLERVSLYDLDVTASSGAAGGALELALTDFTASDMLVAGCNALGSGSAGGGLFLLQNTLATITNSAFVSNSAAVKGGALWAIGVDLQLSGSTFNSNALTGGNLLGAAIFTEQQQAVGAVPAIPMTGNVASNVFSNDLGLPIFDSDEHTPPINDIRYNSNQFFSSAQNIADHATGSGTGVYGHPICAGCPSIKHSPSSLNSFIVVRTGAPSTDKSQVDNSALGTAPKFAFLLAAPADILSQVAVGDAGPTTPAYLTWAAGGGTATLDSNPVATPFGLATSTIGPHTLSVSPATDVATIDAGQTPAAAFGATPESINVGGTSQLSWNLTSGTFEAFSLDHALDAGTGTSGMVIVTPPCTTTYRLCLVTREGGALNEATVFVGELPGEIFSDGFESGNTSAWN